MPGKRAWIIASATVLVCVGLVWGGVKVTSGTGFCLSCHEMRVHHAELLLSAHAKDADGREIACSQCHIPNANVVRMLAAKTWMGLKDVWVHSTADTSNLNRAEMQVVARRFTDDHNCRVCHMDLMRNARNDGPNSAVGQLAHANYLGQNGQSRSGCVGCHINLAHLPNFDKRIPVNRKFAVRLMESNL